MTPGARVAAAAEILQFVLDGTAAELALTRWARGHRFAGSGDRAAIRDLVFQAIRQKQTAGGFIKGASGRTWIAGLLLNSDQGLAAFSGDGYNPENLSQAELDIIANRPTTAINLPDWVFQKLEASYPRQASEIDMTLRHRAPVTIRVNLKKSNRARVLETLNNDDIQCRAIDLSPSAIEIVSNPRRVQNTEFFQNGVIELQDAASQAAADLIPVSGRILDYCAGGGGKILAMAGRSEAEFFAYDVDQSRLKDLPIRAKRAGEVIQTLNEANLKSSGRFDTVVCDVPCSGSGTWRRAPEAKWALTPADLEAYSERQRQICLNALKLTKPGGNFAYLTCSIFEEENEATRDWLLKQKRIAEKFVELKLLPTSTADGFYAAVFEVIDE